ncbi:hypothetical protein ABPG74_003014 [Tetrahymena malaccensis]
MTLQQAQPLLAEFETLIASNSNAPRVGELITQLKRIIFLLPSNDPLTKTKNDQELIASRRFHELCILHSIKSKNIHSFESAINYLRAYYENYPQLPASQDRNQIIALNLLYLLSFNKNTEYHSALELVPVEDLHNNQFIQFVTDLEKQLAIGNYSEALLSKNKSPLAHFDIFLDRIFETIRFETARSAEKAYESLSINDAIKLFNLQNADQLKTFSAEQSKYGEEQGFSWVFENNRLVFRHKDSDKKALFNSEFLISTALSYAHEIEKIV